MSLFCCKGGFFVLDVGYAGAEAGVDGLVSCLWKDRWCGERRREVGVTALRRALLRGWMVWMPRWSSTVVGSV